MFFGWALSTTNCCSICDKGEQPCSLNRWCTSQLPGIVENAAGLSTFANFFLYKNAQAMQSFAFQVLING